MSKRWVTGPEECDPERLRAIEAEGARVQEKIAAIERNAAENTCRMCGVAGDLTEEHAPRFLRLPRVGNLPSPDPKTTVEWAQEVLRTGHQLVSYMWVIGAIGIGFVAALAYYFFTWSSEPPGHRQGDGVLASNR